MSMRPGDHGPVSPRGPDEANAPHAAIALSMRSSRGSPQLGRSNGGRSWRIRRRRKADAISNGAAAAVRATARNRLPAGDIGACGKRLRDRLRHLHDVRPRHCAAALQCLRQGDGTVGSPRALRLSAAMDRLKQVGCSIAMVLPGLATVVTLSSQAMDFWYISFIRTNPGDGAQATAGRLSPAAPASRWRRRGCCRTTE
jgi:hypothetical protein